MTINTTFADNWTAMFENYALYLSGTNNKFYYDGSATLPGNINIGFGYNLHAHHDSTAETLLTTAGGLSFTPQQWTTLQQDCTTNTAASCADLNSNVPTQITKAGALGVLDSFMQGTVVPALTAKVTAFSTLNPLSQAALENIYYQGSSLLGPNSYGDASSRNYSALAEQLAFNADNTDNLPGNAQIEARLLGDGLLALGVKATYDGNYMMGQSLDTSAAQKNDIVTFLTDMIVGNTLIGGKGGTLTAEAYIQTWGPKAVTNFQTAISGLDSYLAGNGIYVATDDQTLSSAINSKNLAFTNSSFELFNAAKYQGTISGFSNGCTLDLAKIGTATSATIGDGNILSILGGTGGTITLQLDPNQNYAGQSCVVTSDGNGGTNVSLGPAPSHTITFSEYPVGTSNPVYTFADNTVSITGVIVTDGAQPASPDVAANPEYNGPVIIKFSAPVTHVEFDAGYFDNLQSTTIRYIGADGTVLKNFTNSSYGVVHYSYDNTAGIVAIDVVNTAYDASGFSVDTVTFSGSGTQAPVTSTYHIKPTGSAPIPGDPVYSFVITRAGDISKASSVSWAVTANGSNPVSTSDFSNGVFPTGTVNFAAGQASQTITVDVLGTYSTSDPVTFGVTLLGPSAGTAVDNSVALGTTLSPPVIGSVTASQQTADVASIHPFAHVTVTDPTAAEVEMVTVTLSATGNGTLTNLGHGTYDATTGVYTDSGTAAAVTADLNGLSFAPTVGQVPSGQVVTTTLALHVVNADNAVATDSSTSITAKGSGAVSVASLLNAYQSGQLATGAAVSDDAGDISPVLDTLQAINAKGLISGIAVTPTPLVDGPSVLSLSATQVAADAGVLGKLSGNFSLEITDSAANVLAGLDTLQSFAGAGELYSITLTDSGTPALKVTAAQLGHDSAALSAISGSYTLSVADTALAVSANLDALQAAVAAGTLSTITLTDGGNPTLLLTTTQLSNDSPALKDISGNFTSLISVTGSQVDASGVQGHGNTFIFNGTASQYQVTPYGNGVSLTVSNSGTYDILSYATALKFSDFTEIVAQTPGQGTVTTGNITELYGAVFGREPDVAGLAFYQAALQANPSTPLTQFAEYFLSSGEYTNNPAHNYAQSAAGDAQFITDLYNNLLKRAPESGAIPFYQKAIDQFTNGLTPGTAAYASAEALAHATVVTYFSASTEFLSDVQITAQTPASSQHWLLLI